MQRDGPVAGWLYSVCPLALVEQGDPALGHVGWQGSCARLEGLAEHGGELWAELVPEARDVLPAHLGRCKNFAGGEDAYAALEMHPSLDPAELCYDGWASKYSGIMATMSSQNASSSRIWSGSRHAARPKQVPPGPERVTATPMCLPE